MESELAGIDVKLLMKTILEISANVASLEKILSATKPAESNTNRQPDPRPIIFPRPAFPLPTTHDGRGIGSAVGSTPTSLNLGVGTSDRSQPPNFFGAATPSSSSGRAFDTPLFTGTSQQNFTSGGANSVRIKARDQNEVIQYLNARAVADGSNELRPLRALSTGREIYNFPRTLESLYYLPLSDVKRCLAALELDTTGDVFALHNRLLRATMNR